MAWALRWWSVLSLFSFSRSCASFSYSSKVFSKKVWVWPFLLYRHYHYEYKLTRLLWKVELKDLVVINTNSEAALQNIRNTINVTACGLLHTHTKQQNKTSYLWCSFFPLSDFDCGRFRASSESAPSPMAPWARPSCRRTLPWVICLSSGTLALASTRAVSSLSSAFSKSPLTWRATFVKSWYRWEIFLVQCSSQFHCAQFRFADARNAPWKHQLLHRGQHWRTEHLSPFRLLCSW